MSRIEHRCVSLARVFGQALEDQLLERVLGYVRVVALGYRQGDGNRRLGKELFAAYIELKF